MKRLALILMSALMGTQIAFAAPPREDGIVSCRVLIIASDLDPLFEAHFETKVKNGSHGGDGPTFQAGPYSVKVTADGRWMTVHWLKDGKGIAAGLFVYSGELASSRAFILYNPENMYDRVSLDCDLIK